MEEQLAMLLVIMETGGMFAPIAFIVLHVLRQFLFIPVVIVCIAGGLMFGTVYGTLFSLFGLFFSSILFYFFIHKMEKTHEKLSSLKRKWFGENRNLTTGQVAILRLLPFIHFHLLSFCLLEKEKNFAGYAKASFFSNIPLALFYTIFGQFILHFSLEFAVIIVFSLLILIYLLREKVTIIKWGDFFQNKNVRHY